MTRICLLVLLGMITSVAHCADDAAAIHEIYRPAAPADANPETEDAAPAPRTPPKKNSFNPLNLISINTDNPLDLNWSGVLELSDPTMRPAGVVIPFLEEYPINNLEVKFNLLNVKF